MNTKRYALAFMTLLLPCLLSAQSEWERPESKSKTMSTSAKRSALIGKSEAAIDPKYLADAVPLADGKVVFTLDQDVPGATAQQIYDRLYSVLDSIATSENQFKESQIVLINKTEHSIAAKYREWLVFKSTALSLDRTVFNYTIIANCSDGHLLLTLSRISYAYEMDRDDSRGLETSAEEWITDKYALNKSKTKLNRISGKFRRKTIDRKDEIFSIIRNAINTLAAQ